MTVDGNDIPSLGFVQFNSERVLELDYEGKTAWKADSNIAVSCQEDKTVIYHTYPKDGFHNRIDVFHNDSLIGSISPEDTHIVTIETGWSEGDVLRIDISNNDRQYWETVISGRAVTVGETIHYKITEELKSTEFSYRQRTGVDYSGRNWVGIGYDLYNLRIRYSAVINGRSAFWMTDEYGDYNTGQYWTYSGHTRNCDDWTTDWNYANYWSHSGNGDYDNYLTLKLYTSAGLQTFSINEWDLKDPYPYYNAWYYRSATATAEYYETILTEQ